MQKRLIAPETESCKSRALTLINNKNYYLLLCDACACAWNIMKTILRHNDLRLMHAVVVSDRSVIILTIQETFLYTISKQVAYPGKNCSAIKQ